VTPPQRHRSYGRNILIALLASGSVFIVEVWASIKTGSLGLLADASHLLVDLSGLVLAYIALRIASRPADPQATFGYARAEVLAAAINGLLIIGVAVAIVWRAVGRLRSPLDELDTSLVLMVGALGLIANVIAAWMLHKDAESSINSKGAFVNVMGDALASVAVIIATLAVRFTGNTTYDTVISFVVAIIIVVAAWGLLRGALDILLERAPDHLMPADIKRAVESLSDVVNVHDLHVWTLTPGNHSLSMHVSITRPAANAFHTTTHAIEELLAERFGLKHCTIQVEPEGEDRISDEHDPVGETPQGRLFRLRG
jgi:cobalt-zinc-cadmium efflux system protein